MTAARPDPGRDFLDDVLGPAPAPVAASARMTAKPKKPAAVPSPPTPLPVPGQRVHWTLFVPQALRDELTDAANLLAGHPHNLTLSEIATAGLSAELERLRAAHNRGRPFPSTGRRARPGRRPG